MTRRPRRGITSVVLENSSRLLQIVGDGAIATARVSDGRLIPLVIVDTTERPDLEEYIRVHQFVADGDVLIQWGLIEGRDDVVALALRFKRPIEVTGIVQFDLAKSQGLLVEKILKTGVLYVQAGKPGDRIKHDVNRPKIILAVPDTGFATQWAEIFLSHAVKRMRAEGFDRAEAKRRAKIFVDEIRKVAEVRPHFDAGGDLG